MHFQLFFVLVTSFLLAACNHSVRPVDDAEPKQSSAGWYIYSNSAFNYSIDIPPTAYIPNKSETGAQIFYGNIPFMQRGTNGDEFDVLLYGKQSTPCSPSITGASETSPLANTGADAEWGRVDVWELSRQEGFIPPYDTDTVTCGGAANVYVFCSEKENRTVVICVNQVTDNPEMAKQIFETFRWVE